MLALTVRGARRLVFPGLDTQTTEQVLPSFVIFGQGRCACSLPTLLKSGCGVYACLNSSRRATAGFSWPRSPDDRTGIRCAGRALVGLLGPLAEAARPEYPTVVRRASPI